MPEAWSGRIVERSMIETINISAKRAAAIRAQRVIDEVAAEVKNQDEPVTLKVPRPLFLEPLC